MHTSAKILLPLALFLFHHAQAIPVAQGGAIATPAGSTYCPETDSYTVSEETQISGEPQLVGSSCTPNTDGGMLLLNRPKFLCSHLLTIISE